MTARGPDPRPSQAPSQGFVHFHGASLGLVPPGAMARGGGQAPHKVSPSVQSPTFGTQNHARMCWVEGSSLCLCQGT